MKSQNGRENLPNVSNGLMYGIVVAHSGSNGRAKVYIPQIHGEEQPSAEDLPEAIVTSVYGGISGTGLIAIPPVGASVIVGFLLGLAWSPVIVGTYYGNEGIPSDGQASPQDKAVTLTNGAWTIKMDFSGTGKLDISGPGDVSVDVQRKVEVKAAQGVDIKVTGPSPVNISTLGEVSVSSPIGINLKTPQSAQWFPNTLPVCPYLLTIPGADPTHSKITDLKGGPPTL